MSDLQSGYKEFHFRLKLGQYVLNLGALLRRDTGEGNQVSWIFSFGRSNIKYLPVAKTRKGRKDVLLPQDLPIVQLSHFTIFSTVGFLVFSAEQCFPPLILVPLLVPRNMAGGAWPHCQGDHMGLPRCQKWRWLGQEGTSEQDLAPCLPGLSKEVPFGEGECRTRGRLGGSGKWRRLWGCLWGRMLILWWLWYHPPKQDPQKLALQHWYLPQN